MLSVKVEIIQKESAKIYRMSTLDLQNKSLMWVSAFLIDGLLIDFGHHHAKDEFLKLLNFDEIEKCVLSHQHEDHYGACYDLIKKFNMPIYSTKETAFLVRLKLRLPPERIWVWGNPKPCVFSQLPNLEEIITESAKFKIIPSPGHCNTLISFYHEKKRLLFSTDAFINSEQSVIFNWENANIMLETLKNFIKLNPKFLFLEDGSLVTISDVVKFIKYWTNIKEQSIELYNQGIKPKEIVIRVFGRESIFKKFTRGALSRENLIRSLLELPPINDRKINIYKS